jgi:predicted phage terminase large subunit-like protein
MPSRSDLDLLEALYQAQARRSFWAFRQYMHPGLVRGWWQRELAGELMRFKAEMDEGKRPIYLISSPPQHGKSTQIVDFIAWAAGHNPDMRTIFSSFSDSLGSRANRDLQRIFDTPKYQATFGQRLPPLRGGYAAATDQRTLSMLKYTGEARGYFRNTTVGGAITGESLDLGVIDDPIRGRADASSPTIRDKVWAWYTDDFRSRFSKNAATLIIMTRWHVDDLAGRLIDQGHDNVRVLRYPAIAEHDEPHRKAGEPLFPELKPLDFLLAEKAALAPSSWQSIYQQAPVVEGGNLFKAEWWRYYAGPPPPTRTRAIFADTAQKTKEGNDWSVFQCWGTGIDGQAVLLDQVRGRWEAPELLAHARAFWAKHKAVELMGALRGFFVEDAVSGTGLIQTLRREGIPMIGVRRATDKVTRAMDAVPFVASGLVYLPEGAPWLSDFLGELAAFPSGAHDDQVDVLVDAVCDILGPGSRSAGVFLKARHRR